MFKGLIYKIKESKDSYFLLLGNLFQTSIQLITFSFLSHILPLESYGSFRQVIFLTQLFVVVGSLGLGQSMYYHLSKSHTPQDKLSVWIHHSILCIAITIALFFISLVFSNQIQLFFLLKSSDVIIAALCFAAATVLQSMHLNVFLTLKKYAVYFTGQFFLGCLKLMSLAAYLYFGLPVETLFSIWAVLHIILWLIYSYIEANALGFKATLPTIKGAQMLAIFNYALPIGLGLMSGILMQQTDKWIFTYINPDPGLFAILSNVTFQVAFINGLYLSFSNVAFPTMVMAWEEKRTSDFIAIKIKYIKEVIVWVIPASIAIILWSKDLLLLLFGSPYQEYHLLFSIFSSTMLLRICSFHDVFLAIGKPTYIVYIQVVEFVVNIALSIFLIYNFGIQGAVISYVIIVYIYAIFCLWFSARLTQTSFFDQLPFIFWVKHIFFYASIALLIMFLGTYIDALFRFYIELVIFGAVFFYTTFFKKIKFLAHDC